MSSFIETASAALAGVGAFYLLEALYYEIKARIVGNQVQAFLDDWEEEHWDD